QYFVQDYDPTIEDSYTKQCFVDEDLCKMEAKTSNVGKGERVQEKRDEKKERRRVKEQREVSVAEGPPETGLTEERGV
ncbi:hypothetical protein COOONC_16842, partial [Cooperia oncophora]